MDIDTLIDAGLNPQPESPAQRDIPDIVDWAQDSFFVIETGRPIVLMPHQKDILHLMTERRQDGYFRWQNLIYSTIKKSGKTTISALYARWAAETWGAYQEVYNLGNKLKQAKERAFKAARRSIELAPPRIKNDWDIQETKLTHHTSGSVIEALPISGAGEAGGNQSLTVWTELWGFQYDDALLMWDELKPVLTRPLSQRFVDTYAGFEGISDLLWQMWQQSLAGERLHDELPVYGNEAAGLCAYIDQGTAARRMPWQLGAVGQAYYAEQELTERPENYQRHHLNYWATSTSQLINIALWDRLEYEQRPKFDEVVIGVDASVSGDCTAMSVTGYNMAEDRVYELETHIFTPENGQKLDYSLTLEPAFDSVFSTYGRVKSVAYDEYQLHDFMTRKAKQYKKTDFYAFPQGHERVLADSAIFNRINQGTIEHSGNDQLKEHIQNADGKAVGDDALRIVKRAASKHIDGLIAMSMSAYRASNFKPPKKTTAIQTAHTGLWSRR